MAWFSGFIVEHLFLLFFVYGLSFFAFGLVILRQATWGSDFQIGRFLACLGIFGILHASQEWCDMLLGLGISYWPLGFFHGCQILGSYLGTVSFVFLLLFGVYTLAALVPTFGWSKPVALVLSAGFVTAATVRGFATGFSVAFLEQWQIAARLAIAFPAAAITAFVFFKYGNSEEIKILASRKVTRSSIGLAVVFATYAIVAGLVVPPGNFFPASRLNTATFLSFSGIPIQVFRAICAFAAAVLIGGILDLFSTESRRRLETAAESLRLIKVQLEHRVQERTAELAESNLSLQEELEQRHRMEASIRQGEEQVRLLLDSTAEAIYGMDRMGNCTFCNPACAQIIGYANPADLNGKEMHALMHHTRSDGSPYPVEECKIYQALRKSEETHGDDEVFWRKDGTSFPAEFWSRPVIRNGQLVGAVVTFVDITERRQAQKAAADALRFTQKILDTSPLGIIIFEKSGGAIAANPASAYLVGATLEEILKLNFLQLKSWRQSGLLALAEQAIASGMVRSGEVHTRSRFGKELWVNARFVPFTHKDELHVLVIFEDITERKHTEDALKEAHAQLGATLEKSEQYSREAVKLTELVDILQSCQTVQEAYKIAENTLPTTLSSPSGALCITAPSRNTVEAVSSWGEGLTTDKTFAPESCWALRRGKIHQVNDANSPLRCAHIKESPPGGYFCIPLAAHGETLGVLCVESLSQSKDVVLDPQEDAMRAFARQAGAVGERISLALANLTLREVLRSQSIRDPLTGLFNRRYMEESLGREVRRAARNDESVTLLMMDVDHFKQFNDTFGHQAGDSLLRELGGFLSQRTRGQDVACRYGGEEFVLIMASTSVDSASKRADVLRSELKQLTVQHAGQVLGKISLSVGVSGFPDHGTTAEELLQAADQALYRAKADGRDRVVIAPPVIALPSDADVANDPENKRADAAKP